MVSISAFSPSTSKINTASDFARGLNKPDFKFPSSSFSSEVQLFNFSKFLDILSAKHSAIIILGLHSYFIISDSS